ncbi:MAG: type IV secretion system DotC family protein [Desulfovibrio sp.]|jgi:hypothetical protein|nr:type IV secretion system DotC family protein [Desulfovibrio sp.]
MSKFPLLAVLALCLAGCAGKNAELAPHTPLPPQVAEKGGEPKEAAPDVAYAEDAGGQYLVVDISADASAGPRRGEPEELAGLLDMKGAEGKATAVTLLRPLAIREAAQLVTFQTAIAYRYRRLLESTERFAAILDAAFDFSPLLMTEGAALIQPPVLTRSGASLRIEKPDTATSAETAYELLEPARFVPVAPHWREFLMVGAFPEPEKPNPAVLPKDDTERAIWRAAVREAWARGLAEADQLYADNVARMTRQYRGIMLYHLLTAQRLLSAVGSASARLPLNASDSKLYIGQQVYRITAPSHFLPDVKGK